MNDERPAPRGPLLHGVDWAVQTGVTDEVMLGTRRLVRRQRQKRLALVGAVAAVALATVIWPALQTHVTSPAPPIASSTVVLEPIRQTLPDGSVVELKAGAEITPKYSAESRRIELVRGEAHFQVVKDPTRPFVVVVGAVAVRAVGTSFSVERGATEVAVVVTTGRVAVDRVTEAPTNSPPETIATLDAGHRTVVSVAAASTAPAIVPLTAAELQEQLAWRIPRLEFTQTPLAEALAMINRHSPVKLTLGETGLGEIRISGLLRADNIEAVLRLLESEHGIRAERRSPTEVVLTPRR